MNTRIQARLDSCLKERKRKRRRRIIAGVLCCAVAFMTSFSLIRPAVTQEQTVYCGYEEHTAHTGACYKENRTLICGQQS